MEERYGKRDWSGLMSDVLEQEDTMNSSGAVDKT